MAEIAWMSHHRVQAHILLFSKGSLTYGCGLISKGNMKPKPGHHSGIVFSTEHGKMCPRCSRPATSCTCRRKPGIPSGDGIVRIHRSTKNRKGKGVSIITGLPLDEEGLKLLAKDLKQRCGSGGTVRQGTIEIQGDHRDGLMKELKALGYTVKLAGG